jgi:hypothetical protein
MTHSPPCAAGSRIFAASLRGTAFPQ